MSLSMPIHDLVTECNLFNTYSKEKKYELLIKFRHTELPPVSLLKKDLLLISDGTEKKVNSCWLCIHFSYFTPLLKSQTSKLELKNEDSKFLFTLFDLIEENNHLKVEAKTLQEIWKSCADFYQLGSYVKEKIDTRLANKITDDNLLDFYNFSKEHTFTLTKEQCLTLVAHRIVRLFRKNNRLLKSKEWTPENDNDLKVRNFNALSIDIVNLSIEEREKSKSKLGAHQIQWIVDQTPHLKKLILIETGLKEKEIKSLKNKVNQIEKIQKKGNQTIKNTLNF